VPGEVDHEPHPVLASRRDVERGGACGISEHYSRNSNPLGAAPLDVMASRASVRKRATRPERP